MMMKYRVHEVAKDLNVSNKEIIELIKENFGETKKHMTALSEDELNFIFEYFSSKTQVENFDEFFAMKKENENVANEKTKKTTKSESKSSNKKATTKSTGNPEEKKIKKTSKNTDDDKTKSTKKDTERKNKKSQTFKETDKKDNKTKNNNDNKQTKPETKAPARTKKATKNVSESKNTSKAQSEPIISEIQKPANIVVDTRAVHVNIDKYNEKYDRMASERFKTDNISYKQKITQKSQQRNRAKMSKKETESERLKRIALERKNKPITVSIPDEITVGELALRLKATAAEVIKKLMLLGVMATINDTIDFDTASLVAMEFHAKIEKETIVTIEERIIDDSEDDNANLIPRAPIVVVMGHVDHGKTSILDAIRNANVTSREAGGITQHIGAYRVNIHDRDITFLDTPGHEAFTTMRARGAQVTDIAILVVAADDGIMPQTVEAINHAKAAGVSIIVAINKMDKIGANPEQVKQQLTEHELVPEEWGGDIPCIPVSAHTQQGIEELLEMVLLVADMKDLKANPDRAAKGTVIEARLDKGRGPIATVLVQNGTLKISDIIVAGTCVGRVRAMTNDKGEKVKSAAPSVPVEITGLDDVPVGGDIFNCVSDERLARELVEQRKNKQKEEQFNSQRKVTLDNLFDQMQQGDIKELKVIVKADVQGSAEAVKQSLEKLSNNEVRVHVIHSAVGAIRESDVMLAHASNAIIVGFNVRPDPVAADSAEHNGVDIRMYRIIYDCIGEIESAMKGMLEPKFREVQLGRAECRKVYKITNVGAIAGSYVLTGKITRNAQIRVVRDGIVICEDKLSSLKRFKDDVKEVSQGYECGIGLEKFNDLKDGDIFEAFIMEEYKDN